MNKVYDYTKPRRENLGVLEARQKAVELDFKTVLQKAENYFNINIKDITGDSRKRKFSEPRTFCFYVLDELGHVQARIGKCFKRDHATVFHGVKKMNGIKDLIESGRCGQDEINIMQKAKEVIAEIWNENHEPKLI